MLGRHRLLAHIASGGMASVHVARAEGTFGFERLVAIKLLHPHLANEDEFVTMIADEARMAARIRHPNVVSVLDVDEDRELGLYLVMEYVEGDHLGNVIHGTKLADATMPASVAVRVVLDLLHGLAAAHELRDGEGRPTPIVHRDVSPHNVLVGVDGMARLADFGVARAEARLTQTEAGRFKGKVAYMAPEQLADGVADERSDLFAVGVVLFETLTGRRLFRADSTAGTLKKLLHEPIPLVSDVDPSLAPLDGVVARALSRDPNERFPSATAMADALAAAARGSVGIAEVREVASVVRASRGAMLAERGARLREVTARHALVEPSSTRRTPIGTIDTNPAIPSRKLAHMPRDPERGRLGRGPLIRWGVAAAAIVGIVGLAMTFRGPLSRASGTAASSARPAEVAPIADSDARVVRGEEPVVDEDSVRITPTIVLRVRVGADGHVIEAAPFQSTPGREELERHAVATVRGYGFEPAHRGGVAVESTIDLPVRFRRASGPEHVVRIKGSDTIGAALAPDLAIAFRSHRPDVHVTVEGLGSSTAFVGLFDRSADLGTSSRPIKDAESREAERLGVVLEETVIGYDGIAIIVHPDNPVASLTTTQLAEIFSGRARRFDRVGGPARAVRALGRPSYSGTHVFFADRVLVPLGLEFGSEVESIERSEELVTAVASDPTAIAYVGAASIRPGVRVVPIATPSGASFSPTEETIREGRYPIYRPLLAYSRGEPEAASAEFLRFVVSEEGHAILRSHGFVPAASRLVRDAAGAAAPRVDEVELVRRIPFRLGLATTPGSAEAVLREVAAFVAAHPGSRVFATGHADSEGTEEDNLRVGRDRARSVAASLARLGVDASRITAESRGSSAPIATNRDESGRERNRRVDLVVSTQRR